MDEAMEKRWQELSEEVLSGMKKWRPSHPKATFREIEQGGGKENSTPLMMAFGFLLYGLVKCFEDNFCGHQISRWVGLWIIKDMNACFS